MEPDSSGHQMLTCSLRFRLAASLFIAGLFLPAADAGAAPDEFVEGEVLVTFKTGIAPAGVTSAPGRDSFRMARHYECLSRRQRRTCGLLRANDRSTAQLIEELETDPGVATVEPNYIRRPLATLPDDTEFSKLWGLENTGQEVNGTAGISGVDVRFLSAWKLARPATGEIVIALVDTGVDITHPDLAANIWTNTREIEGNGIDDDGNGYIDDVRGYDFANGRAGVTDDDAHGTHVAGTLGAVGRNGAGVIGTNDRAKVLPLKVAKDSGRMDVSAILSAFNYALALKESGVNIVAVNASFGSGSKSTIERNAIEALGDAGIILCAAAGNEGNNSENKPVYPASYPSSNIISVAALTQRDGLASFSNYGAVSVDLAAPGENIYSTKPTGDLSLTTSVQAGSGAFAAAAVEFSGRTAAAGLTGTIHHCGQGNTDDFPEQLRGNIALIQRGTITFAAKLTNAMNAGAAAAIIYDNAPASLPDGSWSLGASGDWIPAVQITMAAGESILAQLPTAGTVINSPDPAMAYRFEEGTSMAAPHVSGAVAFAALNFPSETVSRRIARILSNVTPVPALAGKTTSGGRLNLLNIVDTDVNSLPDWWELENFGSLARAPNGDPDGDGFTNLDEFLAVSDPNSPGSHLAFSSVAAFSDSTGRHFLLSFPSVEDRTYRIEWTDTLETTAWSSLGGPLSGTGSTLQVKDLNALDVSPKRFYRLRLD